MTFRQVTGYLDVIRRERHTEEAFLWGMHRNVLLRLGASEMDVREYPDYEGPEEGRLPDDWEEAAAASPLVRRVEVSSTEPSAGDVQ